MGAMVACALAHALPERVDGLALLAPALRLTLSGQVAALLARRTLLPQFLPVIPKFGGSDVHDPVAKRDNPCMPGIPLSAVAELVDLARHVDRLLPGIAAPTLVVASRQDHTVKLSGARRVARRVGSGPGELVILDESYHLVGIDVEREKCAAEVARFFEAIPHHERGEDHY
jgi:carboxylesterase